MTLRYYICVSTVHFRFSTSVLIISFAYILLTKTTAARNGVALSYHSVRGLHFLAVVFVRSIVRADILINRTFLPHISSSSYLLQNRMVFACLFWDFCPNHVDI